LEVTEICTRRQRFDIKGYVNVFWKATKLNDQDIKDDNLEELPGKTYCKIKKLVDRKLNVPISLSTPIRNAIHMKVISSATYYKVQRVIHLVIRIDSATLHEDMSLQTYPFDRQFLDICLSCRRRVRYKPTFPINQNSPTVPRLGEDSIYAEAGLSTDVYYSQRSEKKVIVGPTSENSETYIDMNPDTLNLKLLNDSQNSLIKWGDFSDRREPKKSVSTQKSLEFEHSGWLWTSTCPTWLPVSAHFHMLKIPVHAKLQGSVADEWKILKPWSDYVWGLLQDTYFIRIRIERHSAYHLSHTAGPLFMIVSAAFGAFFVPIHEAADRLSVSLTALLTAVAFQFNVASQLPDAGYSTAIDIYIFLAFLTLFLVILENMFMSFRALEDWDHYHYTDSFLGLFMFGLWTIYNIYFFSKIFSWCRVGWEELSRMELTRAGIQWHTSASKDCVDTGSWGVGCNKCYPIHPQGFCVDRTELVEETKKRSKVDFLRQEALSEIVV